MALHRHRWAYVAHHHGTFSFGGGDGTTVLIRCTRCSAVDDRSLNGHWDETELLALFPAQPREA